MSKLQEIGMPASVRLSQIGTRVSLVISFQNAFVKFCMSPLYMYIWLYWTQPFSQIYISIMLLYYPTDMVNIPLSVYVKRSSSSAQIAQLIALIYSHILSVKRHLRSVQANIWTYSYCRLNAYIVRPAEVFLMFYFILLKYSLGCRHFIKYV